MAGRALLILGMGGLCVAAWLAMHFYQHRDRRNTDRRKSPRRLAGDLSTRTNVDRRADRDRRRRQRRSSES